MSYSIPKGNVISYPPEELRSFHLSMIEWIDNLSFMRPIAEFISDSSLAEQYRRIAAERFREAGWDGDGEIQLFWLPNFVIPRNSSPPNWEGFVVWHVKQSEDGLSWVLSPVQLPDF